MKKIQGFVYVTFINALAFNQLNGIGLNKIIK